MPIVIGVVILIGGWLAWVVASSSGVDAAERMNSRTDFFTTRRNT